MVNDVVPYITGGLMAATGIGLALIAYFVDHHRLAATVGGATLLALLAYKVLGPFP